MLAPGYNGGSESGGGSDWSRDWAVITLETPFPTQIETMGLSQASDSTIGQLTNLHNISHPRFSDGLTCTQPSPGTMFHTQEFEPVAGFTSGWAG